MKINFKYTEKPRKSKICVQCLAELPKASPRYTASAVYPNNGKAGYISMFLCTKCKSLIEYLEGTIDSFDASLSVFFMYDWARWYLENYVSNAQPNKELFYIAKNILDTFSKNYTSLKENNKLSEINGSIT